MAKTLLFLNFPNFSLVVIAKMLLFLNFLNFFYVFIAKMLLFLNFLNFFYVFGEDEGWLLCGVDLSFILSENIEKAGKAKE